MLLGGKRLLNAAHITSHLLVHFILLKNINMLGHYFSSSKKKTTTTFLSFKID